MSKEEGHKSHSAFSFGEGISTLKEKIKPMRFPVSCYFKR